MRVARDGWMTKDRESVVRRNYSIESPSRWFQIPLLPQPIRPCAFAQECIWSVSLRIPKLNSAYFAVHVGIRCGSSLVNRWGGVPGGGPVSQGEQGSLARVILPSVAVHTAAWQEW